MIWTLAVKMLVRVHLGINPQLFAGRHLRSPDIAGDGSCGPILSAAPTAHFLRWKSELPSVARGANMHSI
jgi:hypothetical protein